MGRKKGRDKNKQENNNKTGNKNRGTGTSTNHSNNQGKSKNRNEIEGRNDRARGQLGDTRLRQSPCKRERSFFLTSPQTIYHDADLLRKLLNARGMCKNGGGPRVKTETWAGATRETRTSRITTIRWETRIGARAAHGSQQQSG